MTKVSLIAAIDQEWGLGKANQLLCHLPLDLQHFKALTLGKPVIMGRKTWESIGKPLPGRHNIVISRQEIELSGATVTHSLTEAIEAAGPVPEVMIIGGGEVYRQAIPIADIIYLTRIEHQFNADVFFPKLNQEQWQVRVTEKHAADAKHPYPFFFTIWQKPT